METKTLYIYQKIVNNKLKRIITLTEDSSLGEFIGTSNRLIADPGKVLTDGIITVTCIDTDDPSKWTEIPEPEPEEDAEDNS